MRKKQKKKPAHELLLEEIEKWCRESNQVNIFLESREDCCPDFVEALFAIMRKMVIPWEHLEEVIAKLRKIKKLPHDKVEIERYISSLINHFLYRKRTLPS